MEFRFPTPAGSFDPLADSGVGGIPTSAIDLLQGGVIMLLQGGYLEVL